MAALDLETNSPGLRIELFVADMTRAAKFYADVLGFQIVRGDAETYLALKRGNAIIGLNRMAALPDHRPMKAAPGAKPGAGVEIVLMESDVDAVYAHVHAVWAVSSPLALQPWGLRDFRIVDPDGYYIRVTGLSPQS